MILTCPGCGLTASAQAWANEAEIRATLVAMTRLPPIVQAELWTYLQLFRPPQRALSWKRARRLVAELDALVAAGDVVHERNPPRTCPPTLWAEGMRRMVAAKGRERPGFQNHNYLRAVAWGLAEAAAKQQESAPAERADRREEPEPEGLTDEARAQLAAIRELTRGIGGPAR